MTLREKFEQKRKYLPNRCIVHPKYLRFNGKRYTAAAVSFFLSRGRWAKHVYRTCDTPNCVNEHHLLDRRVRTPGITCWGKKFRNSLELWRHPRCYIKTHRMLRTRLQTMPPEQAVMPETFTYAGKSYASIREIPRPEGVSLRQLYERLGSYWQFSRRDAKKFSPDLALDSHFWDYERLFLRQEGNGYGGTIPQDRGFNFDDTIMIDGVAYKRKPV